jgi:PAS domain S-box-containing protein
MTHKTQILIVDDHPTNIKVLSDLLIAYGFAVLVAKDGENALQKLQRVSPDLILLDVLMPGIDGFETCQRLKAQENTQDIPVIFMTALTDAVDKVKGLTLGAVDYITKPLQHEEVIARINVHLQLRRLNKRLTEQNALLQDEIRSRSLAQTAQRLSEEKFAKIFRANPAAMAILSLESGRFLEINQSLAELTGYAPEEILGKTMDELGFWLNSADRDRYQYFLHATEQWARVELPWRTKTGEIYHLLTSADIIDLAQTRCVLMTAQDVTRSKEAEVALHDREARLSAIFEQLAVGLCYSDLQGNLLQANQKYCNILDYTAAEMMQLTIEQITHPDDWALDQAKTQQLLAEEIASFAIEKRYRRKDGSSVWVNLTVSPIRDVTGAIVMLGGVVEDIDEWKQLAAARQQTEVQLQQSEVNLRASEERLQLVLKANNDGIWDWNIVTNRTFRSWHWDQILGYAPHEMTDRNEEWSDRIHPEDRERVQAVQQAYLTRQAPNYVVEYRLRCKDGNYRWIESRGIAQWDQHDHPIRMIGSCRDITQAKQQAAELQQARDAAEAANRAKSVFLANINHELRTPLTIILGCSELLNLDSTLTLKQQQRLASIDRSVHHLLDLINNVLELSKMEAGVVDLEITTVDLRDLLQKLTEMFLPQTTAKGLQLAIERSPDLPRLIQTDERKLNQILINLLSNAVKFTETGGVRLVAQVATEMTDAALTLSFVVTDTGEGIAASALASIFEAFVQTDTGRKSQKGTGLGLAIGRQLARLMQGDITVQSVVGQGSQFSLRLPVQLAISPQPVATLLPSITRQILGAGNYRVLVVEDTADMREILVHILSVIGFEVREAAQGQAAIALWQDWQPHLILMDMRMPVMDGYEATRQIRAQEQALQSLGKARGIAAVPAPTVIIAVTANALAEDRQAILAAGCNDIMGKPFSEVDLVALIGQHLGVKAAVEIAASRQLAADLMSSVGAPVVAPAVADIPQLLTQMPKAWVLDLQQAALRLNVDRCFQLIEQLPSSEDKLSQVLIDLLDNFRFDVMIDLIALSQVLSTARYPVRSENQPQ